VLATQWRVAHVLVTRTKNSPLGELLVIFNKNTQNGGCFSSQATPPPQKKSAQILLVAINFNDLFCAYLFIVSLYIVNCFYLI